MDWRRRNMGGQVSKPYPSPVSQQQSHRLFILQAVGSPLSLQRPVVKLTVHLGSWHLCHCFLLCWHNFSCLLIIFPAKMSHRFSLACQLLSWYWQHGHDVEKDSASYVLVGSLKQKLTQDSDALGLLGEEFPEKGSKGSQIVSGRSYMKMDSQQQPSFSVIYRGPETHDSHLRVGPTKRAGRP